ncbi:hypothetical protein LCGC14_0170350 [marine sediment metagenome]|jgi:hypothetical protein|uniref:Uncharacterized protein n=1 Tax=marine sediment metagenome TaxID=412755 RepID=A0A0F9XAL9_9ZZZZ
MDNSERFLEIIAQLGPTKGRKKVTHAKVATLLTAVTGRPCSERAIRSWLTDPENKSYRPCPDWAVAALARAKGYMQKYVDERRQQQGD